MSQEELVSAAISGEKDKVKSLLLSGTKMPETILQEVIFSGWAQGEDIGVIELLVEAGADVNSMGKSGTPLYSAAMVGPFPSRSLKVTDYLLKAGADPNLCRRESPLHLAVSTIADKTVARLIEGGADINAINDEGKSVLHVATYSFYEFVGDPEEDEVDDAYETAEMYVLNNLKPLLAASPNQDVKDEAGETAIESVFLLKNYPVSILELLISSGAPIGAQIQVSDDERVSLVAAMIMKSFPNTEFSYDQIIDCVERGNDVLTPVEIFGGRSLLEIAIIQMPEFSIELFKKLPRYAQSLTPKSKASMLHLAVFSGSEDLVKLLLELGVDPTHCIQEGENKGKSAVEFGREKGIDDSLLALLE